MVKGFFAALMWKGYTVCKVRNNLIDKHNEVTQDLASFRYAAFATVDFIGGLALVSVVSLLLVFFTHEKFSNLWFYLFFCPIIAWGAEIIFGMLALLVGQTFSGGRMNPFLEATIASRLYYGFRQGLPAKEYLIPKPSDFKTAITLTVVIPIFMVIFSM